MRKIFTSLQLFIAAALSLVVFVGVFWVEKTNFEKEALLLNPLDQFERLDERLVIQGAQSKLWLHDTGELFMAFPATKVNFKNQVRTLEDGALFVDTNFILDEATQAARNGLKSPFDVLNHQPLAGQIKVGPVLVSVSQGIAVIERDLIRQEVQIYAYDHAVDVFLPSAQVPFMLPAGHTMLLKEGRAKLLGGLYYTKLEKELKSVPVAKDSSLKIKLEKGLEASSNLRKDIIAYAERVVLSWERFAPSSFMGKLFGTLDHIQRYYAVGVDKPYKIAYQYRLLKRELTSAYYYLAGDKRLEALESGESFLQTMTSSEWARFFVEQPELLSQWNSFARTQRIRYFYQLPSSREAPVLRPLWGASKTLSSFKDYQENYYLFEKYYAQSFRSAAQEQLDFLATEFKNLPAFEPKDQTTLSRMRRQLSFLLKQDLVLRNENSLTLYKNLIEAEQQVIKNSTEASQEIRLEVAQELLFFLKDLLGSETRQNMTIILLRAYRDLEISELTKSLGRSIFSAQERDTLDKIQGLGSLSEEALERVRNSNRNAAEALEDFKTLDNLGLNEGPAQSKGPSGVQTEEDLLGLLSEKNVITQGMSVRINTQESNTVIIFSEASYEGFALQGTFQTEKQKFSFLQLGEVTENRASAGSFEGFLKQMLKEASQNKGSGSGPSVISSGPNNSSSAAILRRRNVLKRLATQNVIVKLDDVQMINEDLTKAKVAQASFDKQYLLSFVYDFDSEAQISEVSVEYGRNSILLSAQKFAQQNLEASLKAAIEEKLTQQQESEED